MFRMRVATLLMLVLLACLTLEITQHVAIAQNADTDEQSAIDAIRKLGGAVRRIAADTDGVEVDFHLSGRELTDEGLAHVAKVRNVVSLHLKDTKITNSGLVHLKNLGQLRTLHLERTGISDDGVLHLAQLKNLEYLNLYGTKIGDGALAHLIELKKLHRLYLWQTEVTDGGVAQLAKAIPDLRIERGANLTDPANFVRKQIVMKQPPLPLAGKPWKLEQIRFESGTPTPEAKATILYRAKGTTEYTSAVLTRTADGQFEVTIPDSVTSTPFQYYIEIREPNGPPSTLPPLGSRVPNDVMPDAEKPVLPAEPKTLLVKNYRVTLNWTAATDDRGIQQYLILRGKDRAAAVASEMPIGTTDAKTLEFSDASPPAGQTVVYAIVPVDVAGQSGDPRAIQVDVPKNLPPDNALKLKATAGSNAVALSWMGDYEPDVTHVLILRADAADAEFIQVAELAQLKTTTWLDKDVKDKTRYRYVVKLRDTGGLVSAPSAEALAESGRFLRRVNCGGIEIATADGTPWEADAGNLPGTGRFTAKTAKINGTTAEFQALYRSERWSYRTIRYQFDVDPGKYLVTLHFAETNRGFSAKGKRTFDIYLNSEKKHTTVDVFDKVGASTAYQLPTEVEINSKELVVELRKNSAGPALKGIEVRELPE